MLDAVKQSPSGPPRMSELAEWLTLSRGGITKLVDRLQAAGCSSGSPAPRTDAACQAELTPAGERMLEEMQGVYVDEVERHLSALSAEEADLVATALSKVTESTCENALSAESAATV